jgi:hypothetical protein
MCSVSSMNRPALRTSRKIVALQPYFANKMRRYLSYPFQVRRCLLTAGGAAIFALCFALLMSLLEAPSEDPAIRAGFVIALLLMQPPIVALLTVYLFYWALVMRAIGALCKPFRTIKTCAVIFILAHKTGRLLVSDDHVAAFKRLRRKP